MVVCKCIVPLRQEGTLNSSRAASPLAGLVEGEEGGHWLPPVVSPSKLGGTVTYMMLKDKAKDRRKTSSP
ncbi:hypothetical protein TNCV_3128921 [Trichonephila clavipes]|nr:hypothetical protein TNCV_3128921 [Trichonephila clavipes]